MRSRFKKLRHDLKCRKMKLFLDMQLIQKLRNDQKCMKKVIEDMSGSYEHKSNQGQDHRLASTVPGRMASPLAVGALGSTLP
ncbi:hypothetical protein Tco_0980203 [Tanacetum coccineum]